MGTVAGTEMEGTPEMSPLEASWERASNWARLAGL